MASGFTPERPAPQLAVVLWLNAQQQSWSSLRTRIWRHIAGSSGALRRRVDGKVRRLGQARGSSKGLFRAALVAGCARVGRALDVKASLSTVRT